jgi:hypothetical protein
MRTTKLERAREYGRTVAQAVVQDFTDHPEYRGPNFTWEWLRGTWIPKYIKMQLQLNFGPPFPVKEKYLQAAVEAGLSSVSGRVGEG